MDFDTMITRFETERPRLHAVAYRITGNPHDADDVLQSAWIKTSSAAVAEVECPSAWLTTVVSREALDVLRRRRRRSEVELDDVDAYAIDPEPEEESLLIDGVGRALLVVLDRLTPAQRVAFVLHDLFSVSFDDIGEALQRSPTAAKKLASRARAHVDGAHEDTAQSADTAVVQAYLNASRDGDIATLIDLLAPGVIRIADRALLPPHVPSVIQGSADVAEQTRHFTDRAGVSATALIDGQPAVVIAPHGRLVAAMLFRIERGVVQEIRVRTRRSLGEAHITAVP